VTREPSAAINENSLHRALEVIERVVAERHDRPSLVSRIACEIGAEIVESILCPGADLNSVDLAKRYATSRTPIREALMLLEKEGLVAIPPRRRPRVADLPIEDIREIYRVRAALFEAVAIEVVEKATPSDFVLLREFLAKMSRAHMEGDVTTFLWANVDFYNVFTTIARNRSIRFCCGRCDSAGFRFPSRIAWINRWPTTTSCSTLARSATRVWLPRSFDRTICTP
jgi:DNA-binding GntR family transcriptional regulator